MNGIVKSWLDSLKVFIPGNFKLFFLVTLKSFFEGAKAFFKCFWWLLVLAFGLVSFIRYYAQQDISVEAVRLLELSAILMVFVSFAILFFWIVAVRPSVSIKDGSYFLRYASYSLSSLVLVLLVSFIGNIFFNSLVFVPFETIRLVLFHILHLLGLLFVYNVFFFWFESDGSFTSIFAALKRAVIFIFYNLPGLLVFGVIFYLIALFVPSIIGMRDVFYAETLSMTFLLYGASLLFQFMIICFLHNYFIKRVHDHSELYYS